MGAVMVLFKDALSEWTDMLTFSALVEYCPDTGLYVGYIPGFPGAHSQGATLDELKANLTEVVEMLLEDTESGVGGIPGDSVTIVLEYPDS